VQISHQRGAFALGGMSAFTPGRSEAVRAAQVEKVRADKHEENAGGHDGSWVSHPYFIGPALEAFPQRNQLAVTHDGLDRFPQLLPEGGGPYTRAGLRTNVRVGIGYLEGWRREIGCVAWDDLMEDLATLEISRAQTWQWLRHGVRLTDGTEDGTVVDEALVRRIFREELQRIQRELQQAPGNDPQARQDSFATAHDQAVAIFCEPQFRPFLTDASEPV